MVAASATSTEIQGLRPMSGSMSTESSIRTKEWKATSAASQSRLLGPCASWAALNEGCVEFGIKVACGKVSGEETTVRQGDWDPGPQGTSSPSKGSPVPLRDAEAEEQEENPPYCSSRSPVWRPKQLAPCRRLFEGHTSAERRPEAGALTLAPTPQIAVCLALSNRGGGTNPSKSAACRPAKWSPCRRRYSRLIAL